jgi:hypothetical protein
MRVILLNKFAHHAGIKGAPVLELTIFVMGGNSCMTSVILSLV